VRQWRNQQPLDPIWYLVAAVVIPFVAGLIINYYRHGAVVPPGL
jgi:hypothetical protein